MDRTGGYRDGADHCGDGVVMADLSEIERCVMPCPVCEGEGEIADGLDDAACSIPCPRCLGNAWLVDTAAIAALGVKAAMENANG